MKLRAIVRKLTAAPARQRMTGFDEVYYRNRYRDAGRFTGPALQHYLIVGWKEGRDPSARFSTDGYLAGNPDVKASGMNPLIHFLDHGLAEGRKGWEKATETPAPLARYMPNDEQQKPLKPPKAP